MNRPSNLLTLLLFVFSFAVLAETNAQMSEVWKKKYQVADLDAAADFDRDGQDNMAESLAGTNPRDPGSLLSFSEMVSNESVLLLSWESSDGTEYQLQSSPTLADDSWVNVGPVVVGNGATMTVAMDAFEQQQIFFQVKVVNGRSALINTAISSIKHDVDGDGQSDVGEISAGFDPFDSQSNWQDLTIHFDAALSLKWKTEKAKCYQIQSRAAGTDEEWVDQADAYYGTGDMVTAIVPHSVQREYRLQVYDVDSDGDGLNDWEEYQVGLDPSLPKTDILGVADAEALATMLAADSVVEVKASRAVANITQMEDGGFQITRRGGLDEITVDYSVGGTAVAGEDYVALQGTVTIPFGAPSVLIPVKPLAESAITLTGSVKLNIESTPDYLVGAADSQQVNVIREVAINVQDYGAVGDGFTNDTAAVQAAMEALEQSSEHNTLYFPEGTYALKTKKWLYYRTGTNEWCFLEFAKSDMEGRDLIIRGDEGAELYASRGSDRVHMLAVYGTYRSLECRGMKWRQTSTPKYATIGVEPNGSDGVSLLLQDGRVIEFTEFNDCEFVNCHGAVWCYGVGYDVRGHMKVLSFLNCRILNPYGANTVDSHLAHGGGQQCRVTPWIDTAIYRDNRFEGGGEDMTHIGTCPGGRVKDGCHFGSPLNLIFENNEVLRMGVEAIHQNNDVTLMGWKLSDMVIPPADGVTEVEISVSTHVHLSTYEVGQKLNIRTPGVPGQTAQSNIFTVTRVDNANHKIWLVNDSAYPNAAPGTAINSSKPIYLNDPEGTSRARIAGNYFDGTMPPGGNKGITMDSAIAYTARGDIENNVIINHTVGIMGYDEVHTPIYPAMKGSRICGNYILVRDPRDNTLTYTYGMQVWGDFLVVDHNTVITPASQHFVGIATRGQYCTVSNNNVLAHEVIRNGYTSSRRSLGMGGGDFSAGNMYRSNRTYGMDVGVGPIGPRHYRGSVVIDHQSINDVLGVDSP